MKAPRALLLRAAHSVGDTLEDISVAESPQPGKSQRLTSVRKVRSATDLSGRFTLSRGWWRRHVWLAPVLAMVAVAVAGTWLRSHVEQSIQEQVEEELRALLNADVTALKLWLHVQEDTAEATANDADVEQAVAGLVKYAEEAKRTPRELLDAPDRARLQEALQPVLEAHNYSGYGLVSRDRVIIASDQDTLVGLPAIANDDFTERMFSGKPSVSRPYRSRVLLPDERGEMVPGLPTMFVAAPVRSGGEIIAYLGIRIRPGDQFSEILNVGRFGETGETYAFDKSGTMISASRFDDQLKQIGLLADTPEARSELTIELRDPGVDMTTGARPSMRRADQPLTRLAADAVQGKSTVSVDAAGYRDYRGRMNVGAWTWLPEYGFGVATECDQEEVYQPVYMIRAVFWALFGLLAAAALTLFAMTLLAGRLEKRMREAVLAAGKLGQYALEAKIGEGGMGAVYRARHALLRRPTAIKLIEPSKTSEVAVARFEREVQHTSQLNHPNTITIYDYGRTDEGVFYYAMEFLEGFSLQTLGEKFGPQPDGRVIQILLQVCGSLLEAHSLGLIHRDIKPANIMLTRRAGVSDFVKLLDFGLVKATDNRMQTQLTAANTITGTPLYLPPECIQDPESADARSDLYSLGGVGYFLLTGQPPFEAASVLEVIRRQVEEPATAPSQKCNRPISPELEAAVLACLEKSPDKRPQSAGQLAEMLANCTPREQWTGKDAVRWWQTNMPNTVAATSETATKEIELGATVGFTTVQRQT